MTRKLLVLLAVAFVLAVVLAGMYVGPDQLTWW